ncbi:MAG: LCP family protein, partial [Sciscionella sp.]
AQPSAQDAPAGRARPTGTAASATRMSRPVTRPAAPERHTDRPDSPAEAQRGAPPVPPERNGTARAATPQGPARPLPSKDGPAGQSTTGATRVPPRRPQPERPENMDPSLLTDEMEPVGQEVQRRRKVDDTLARFSAVHDEMVQDERRRRGRMSRILPWVNAEDELDEALATPSVRRHNPESQDSGAASRGEQGRRAGTTRFAAPTKAVGHPASDEATRLAESLGAAAGGMHEDERDGTTGSGGTASAGDDEPLSRLQAKKQRRQRRAATAGKITAISAATLVFLVTGVAWGAKVWLNAKFTEIDALDENSSAIQNAARQSGDQNFLLVGSDTRAGASGNAKVGTDKQVKGARSDTVMIAHIPADRKRVVMVSFPRDLEVNRPDCQRWNSKTGQYIHEMVPVADEVKLNSVYADGGPKCMTKVIQQLSGLRINHFTGIDFTGFKEMVDAVRGVDVCVSEPIQDSVLGTVIKKPGNQTISGDTALNYVRARHVAGDPTSDYGRIQRQQRFLSSLLRKVLSQQVLLDPGKLNAFVNAFARATYGQNMGVDELLGLAQSLQDLHSSKVTFITVPTVGYANSRGNEVLRTDDTHALFQAVIDNAPLPGEQRSPKSVSLPLRSQGGNAGPQPQPTVKPLKPVTPSDIKIQVLNAGNTTEGIATNTSNALAEQGFQVMQTENASERVDHTVIRYSDQSEAKARTLAASVPGTKLEKDPPVAGAVILLIGPDFDGKVTDGGASGRKPTSPAPPGLSTVNGADASCS